MGLNDSSGVEGDGICIEIQEPDLIVLPIPEDKFGSNTSVLIGVYLTNNTPTSFRFNPNDTLIPKLVTLEGQVLQGQAAPDEQESRVQTNMSQPLNWAFKLTRLLSKLVRWIERSETKFDEHLIPPGEGEYLSLIAMLIRHNSNLQLQLFNGSGYLPVIFRLNSFCFFDALQPGTYQLWFAYGSPRSSESSFNSEMRKEVGARQLTTQLVNLHLIEPVGFLSSAVEVKGIWFETLMPERRLNVPRTHPNASTSVQVGICITNRTAMPVRFSLFATLIPRLMGTNGQALQGWRTRLGTSKPIESDFPLVMPGESMSFFPQAELLWHKGNYFALSIAAGDGSLWTFEDLKPDFY